MKKNRKITASALAAVMLIGSAGCGGGGGRGAETAAGGGAESTTAATTAAATTTLDPNKEFETELNYDEMASIEQVDSAIEEGAGSKYVSGQTAGTIRALCYYDFKDVDPEKNILPIFAERFGGTVEVTMCTSLDYMEKLGIYVAAGDSPDIVRHESDMTPGGFIQNRFTALDEWLDKDSPVWSEMSSTIDKLAYNGKHYYYPQEINLDYGVIYNTAFVEEIGGNDPMDLYFSGEWDWNAFEDLLKLWMANNPENIGVAAGESTPIHFAVTSGTPSIYFTGTEIVNNMRTPAVTKTMQFIENLTKEGYVLNGWRDPGEGFADGKLMFYIMPIKWGLNTAMETHKKKNLEGEVRAVPIPKCPDADKYYIMGDTYGYLVPAGAKNVQGAVSWILAGRFYRTDPEQIAKDRELLLYDGAYYYPKCTKCKHQFESERGEENETCPECGEPRKPKVKVTYSDRQMQVMDDMEDPTKFEFLFDDHRGFGTDARQMIMDTFDDPFFEGEESYTTLLEENYNAIEANLDGYRTKLAEAISG